MQLWRPFQEESLERLPESQYELRRADLESRTEEVLYRGVDRQAYLDKALEFLSEAPLLAPISLRSRVSVSRKSIVTFLLSVTRELASLHKQGQVHGDIKPSNILASRSGATLIDSVGLVEGEISPLVTAGWSPPEQLVRRPLRCSADVFTVGLLFLRALGAQRLGRVASYRLPEDVEAIQIEDPAIYFAPEERVFVGEGRIAWAELLEKALHSNPAARQPDAASLGDAVEAALAVEEPSGELTIQLPWGEKPVLSSNARGANEVAWVIADRVQ